MTGPTRPPLATVRSATGHPVGLATPGAPWLADIIRRHAAAVAAEAAHREAVRAGLAPPPPPTTRWLISDRD
jgi:hypothetical protein